MSLIVRIYQEKNEDAISPEINQLLEEDNYVEICELIKTKDVNEFDVIFKTKIPFQLLGKISKSSWYYKYHISNDEFWKRFEKDDNNDIEFAYKTRYLQNNEQEISNKN